MTRPFPNCEFVFDSLTDSFDKLLSNPIQASVSGLPTIFDRVSSSVDKAIELTFEADSNSDTAVSDAVDVMGDVTALSAS